MVPFWSMVIHEHGLSRTKAPQFTYSTLLPLPLGGRYCAWWVWPQIMASNPFFLANLMACRRKCEVIQLCIQSNNPVFCTKGTLNLFAKLTKWLNSLSTSCCPNIQHHRSNLSPC